MAEIYIHILDASITNGLLKWVTAVESAPVAAVVSWREVDRLVELLWEANAEDIGAFTLACLVRPGFAYGDTVWVEINANLGSSSEKPRRWIYPDGQCGRLSSVVWTTEYGVTSYVVAGGGGVVAVQDTLVGGTSVRFWDTFGQDIRAGWDLTGLGWFTTPDTSGTW
jgi:hypothetical protein